MHAFDDFEARTQAELDFQRAVARFRRVRYVPRLSMHGLTPAEVHVLMAVGGGLERGEDPNPRDIGRMMHVSPSALSQTLGSLEKKGFITRERSEADARRVSLGLTDAGRAFVREGIDAFRQSMRDLRDYLGDDDLREFARLLDKVDAFYRQQVREGKAVAHPMHGRGHAPAACGQGKEGPHAPVA